MEIRRLISSQNISSQEKLMKLLVKEGFELTQATLSRDLKYLKVAKMPDDREGYVYILPDKEHSVEEVAFAGPGLTGLISIDFAQGLAIKRTGLGLQYLAYAKPTGGFTKPVMASLAASGLRVMQWGVESGSQRTLNRMKKGLRLEKVEDVLAAAHAAGVLNMVFLLFGFPGETPGEWGETLAMVERNRENIDVVADSLFILPEGCDVFNNPADYGVTTIDQRATDIPITMAYDYQVAAGISQLEAKEMIAATRDKLTEYYGRVRDLYRLRDHLLFLASPQWPPGSA